MKSSKINIVIDCDLLKKISCDMPSDMRPPKISMYQLLEYKMKNENFTLKDIRECYSFQDILSAINNQKCVLSYSTEIRLMYKEILKKCPNEIRTQFNHAYSSVKRCNKITDRWSCDYRDLVSNTPLASKIPYLCVAHQLHELFDKSKTVISTEEKVDCMISIISTEEKVNCINENHIEILDSVEVTYQDVHSMKEEIDKI